MAKKKIKTKKIWCLEVDFENGDGREWYRIGISKDEAGFLSAVNCLTPPPKVRVKCVTPLQWKKAVALGKKLAGE
jgi:hypothetical protein